MAAVLWLLSAGACVRLNEPEQFECKSDSDCLGSEVCRVDVTSELRCWPKGSCSNDQHCASDEVCDTRAGQCEEVKCTDRGDFCDAYACDLGRHTCHETCSGDAECAPTYTCLAGECIEPQLVGERCLVDQECQTRVCCVDPDDGHGYCRVRCALALAKLPLAAACMRDGQCYSKCCLSSSDAGVSQTCGPYEECFEPGPCESDEDCRVGECCPDPDDPSQDACQIGACQPQPGGGRCDSDAGCEGGLCASGLCLKEAGEACQSASECKPRLLCCDDPSGAISGRQCSHTCRPRPGDPCGGELSTTCAVDATCVALAAGEEGICSAMCSEASQRCPFFEDSRHVPLGCVPDRILSQRLHCRPVCQTDRDCRALGGLFRCVEGVDGRVCDFSVD